MTETLKPTSTPWSVEQVKGHRIDQIRGARGEVVVVFDGEPFEQQEIDAAFMVRRVNAHAKLLETMCFFASVIKSGEPWTATCEAEYRAALVLASDA